MAHDLEKCYILKRQTDGLVYVTSDKDFADDQYSTGNYIMLNSVIYNPKEQHTIIGISIHGSRNEN